MPDMKRRGFLAGILGGATLLGGSVEALAFWHETPKREPRRMMVRRSRVPPRRHVEVVRDFGNLGLYRAANVEALAGPESARRVVMMGDSITENWLRFTGGFYAEHGLVGRGISGQTSAQMLLRFGPDVAALKPQAVHIMAGTNDLVGAPDPYDAQATQTNLEAMALLANAHGIRVVMASVPPASGFAWGGAMDALKALNVWINDLCARNGYTYCDYWPVLEAPGGKLKPELGLDTVHPNEAGYAVMGPVLVAAIDKALQKAG